MHTTKLKIAVEFFGHLRTFEKCAPSIRKHLLNRYDCDVFMHTWSETEHRTQTWHQNKQHIQTVDQNIKEKIINLYSPKAITIETQNLNQDDDITLHSQHSGGKSKISAQGMKFMLRSKNEVNKLRQTYQAQKNINYDYVLMIRPDILLKNDFKFENIDRIIKITGEQNARYAASNLSDSPDFPIIGNVASDILYFGTPQSIDKAIAILNNINFTQYINNMWNPETLFKQELQKNGINNQFITYLYGKDWEILRTNQKTKLKNKLLSIRLRKNFLKIKILEIIPHNIINIKINIFSYLIQFSCGKENN